MLNPKIVEIIKLAKALVDSRDKDFCGFEAGFSSSDGRQFKIELNKRYIKLNKRHNKVGEVKRND